MSPSGFAAPPPADDVEYRLAHRLLGSTNAMDREILYALVGHPKRYSELKPLLGSKSENNLTMALARLRRDGLIETRVDARRHPVVRSHALSELGVLVVLTMQQMLPAHESARILLRGKGAADG